MGREEKMDLLRDLPRGRPNLRPIHEFMRFFSMMEEFGRKDLLTS